MVRTNEFDIYAVSEGIVLWVLPEIRLNDGYSSPLGLRLLVRHLDGTIGWYCHLKRTSLEKGNHLKAGSLIGEMGNTGMSVQTHLNIKTIDYIKTQDIDLWTWLIKFQNKAGEPIKLIKKMKRKLTYYKRLERYLDKHLHIMLTQDKDHLHSKYAINPIEWLLSGCPPCNTKQSIDGGWKAIYTDFEGNKYEHKAVDTSGRPQNLITGWENVTQSFKSEFYNSIDKVA